MLLSGVDDRAFADNIFEARKQILEMTGMEGKEFDQKMGMQSLDYIE